jgi:hypothetical protein
MTTTGKCSDGLASSAPMIFIQNPKLKLGRITTLLFGLVAKIFTGDISFYYQHCYPQPPIKASQDIILRRYIID